MANVEKERLILVDLVRAEAQWLADKAYDVNVLGDIEGTASHYLFRQLATAAGINPDDPKEGGKVGIFLRTVFPVKALLSYCLWCQQHGQVPKLGPPEVQAQAGDPTVPDMYAVRGILRRTGFLAVKRFKDGKKMRTTGHYKLVGERVMVGSKEVIARGVRVAIIAEVALEPITQTLKDSGYLLEEVNPLTFDGEIAAYEIRRPLSKAE